VGLAGWLRDDATLACWLKRGRKLHCDPLMLQSV